LVLVFLEDFAVFLFFFDDDFSHVGVVFIQFFFAFEKMLGGYFLSLTFTDHSSLSVNSAASPLMLLFLR
jgi:hypothetical protein